MLIGGTSGQTRKRRAEHGSTRIHVNSIKSGKKSRKKTEILLGRTWSAGLPTCEFSGRNGTHDILSKNNKKNQILLLLHIVFFFVASTLSFYLENTTYVISL